MPELDDHPADPTAFAADQVGAGPLTARFSLLPDPGR